LFAAVTVLGGVVATFNFDALRDTVWGLTLDKGDLTRLDIWQQSLDLLSRHLLLGTGPAGYAAYFWNLYMGSQYSMSTHNNYMDVLAQTGLVGGVVFVWLLVALLVAGWQARSFWRSGFEGGFAQGAFAGLLGLLVGMSQGDWFIPFVYNQTIAGFRFTVHSWVFLGFLTSLALIRERQSAERALVRTSKIEVRGLENTRVK
jgi:O-antigen ligase